MNEEEGCLTQFYYTAFLMDFLLSCSSKYRDASFKRLVSDFCKGVTFFVEIFLILGSF